MGSVVFKHFPGYGDYWGEIVSLRDAVVSQPMENAAEVEKKAGKDFGLGCSKCRWWGCSVYKPLKKTAETLRFYRVEYEDGDSEEYEMCDVHELIRNAKEAKRLRAEGSRSYGTFHTTADCAFEYVQLPGGRFKRRRIGTTGKWDYYCR